MSRKRVYFIGYNVINIVLDVFYLYVYDLNNKDRPPNKRIPQVSMIILILQTLTNIIFYFYLKKIKFYSFSKLLDDLKRIKTIFTNLLLNTIAIFILANLLGAPLINWDKSVWLAFSITFLSTIPHYIRQSESKIISQYSDLPICFYYYMTIIGAWLGAFLLKLDWIVPWKQYPTPILASAIAFNSLANFLGIITIIC